MAFIDKFVSLYHLDDNAQDAIGPNDGSEGFADYTTDAAIGTHAFLGDGIDNRTNVGHDSSLDITASISMGGLIKPNSETGYSNKAVVNKINTYYLSIGYPTINRYGFAVWIDGAFRTSSAPDTVLDTTAYHAVIGTYDGQYVKIFIDKILRGITEYSGSILSNPTEDTCIGSWGTESGGFLDAKMDEMFIANTNLTDGGVTIIGNAATGEVEEVTDLLLAGTPLDEVAVAGGQKLVGMFGLGKLGLRF
jgi:hypothetical protein